MRKVYLFLGVILLTTTELFAQVSVTATAGTAGPTSYPTLKDAFDAVNAGTHQGAVTISITASTTETAPAVLNSSGTGTALYTAVLVRPTANSVVVSGDMPAGRGLIELNGADDVTIDGDNPNVAGINKDLTLANIAANTVAYGSVIRVATSTTAGYTGANNITIKNVLINGNANDLNASGTTSTTGPGNASFGIIVGPNGGAPPTAISNVTGAMAAGTTASNFTVTNCKINQCARGIAFLGTDAASSTGVMITNNEIGDQNPLSGVYPFNAPANTVYIKGVYVQGTNAATITGNSIMNILSYVNTNLSGIELNSGIGTGTINISNNGIEGVSVNVSSFASFARGISVTSAGAAYTISDNDISRIYNNTGSSTSQPTGIHVGTTAPSGMMERNAINTVYNMNTGLWGSNGFNLVGGNSITLRNNFVYDINMDMSGGFGFGATYSVSGIKIGAGTGHKVYHNTVHLEGTLLGTAASSITTFAFGISTVGVTGADVRNNIFSNLMTGGTSSIAHVSIYLPSGATSAMDLTLNNNAYYSGSSATTQGIAQVGTTASAANLYLASNFIASANTPASNLRAYTGGLSASGTNDNASMADGSGTTPFVSATDLHINLGTTATQLESGGAAVGVTSDIDGNVRPGPAGSVNGGGTAPDIGADEFDGVPLDLIAPGITYTALGNTCGTGDRTITGVTITDASGVPTAGTTRPRIYYNKNGGAWFSQPGTLTAGTANNGTWSFTIVAADMGGLLATDVVAYYIIAQDVASTPNIGSNPGGVDATNVNTINTPPATPASYTIGQNLTGTFTVGASGAYATLTSAINAFNAACLTGAVTFSLTDADYSTGETFPMVINSNSFLSATNTLTIRPATGNAAVISGATTTSVIKINGADYVTIDGINTGGASLTISNTDPSTAASVIWIGSGGASNGATNNSIKNLTVTGNGPAATLYGIYVGSGTTLGGTAQSPNSDLLVQGNTISKAQNGIFVNGNAGTRDQNVVISGNTLGSSTATDKLGLRGIVVQNSQSFTITNNMIGGVVTATSTTSSGILVGGSISGGTITRNIIRDVKNTNTGGWGSNGLWLNASTTGSNILVANNFIFDIASHGYDFGFGSSDNGYGIIIGDGFTPSSGYNIYYNTVVLNTNQTSGSGGQTATINITGGVSGAGAVNLVNNIFVNAQTTGLHRFAIYSAAANSVYGTIDYNDYHTTGPNLGYIGSNRSDLAAIMAGFGQNTHSINVLPVFVSADDLHLDAASNASLENLAIPLPAVTNDIDLQTRDGGAPDMGGDELPAPACANAVGGTITPANALLCVSGSTNITAIGFSAGVGSGYQWQSSPNNTVWTDIGGATIPGSYNTGTITATTYYRLKVTCTSGIATAYSNVVTIAVNPNPTVTVSPAGPVTLCEPAAQTLSVTATSASNPSYQWRLNGTDISGEVASTLSAGASGSYSVRITDGNTTCSVISASVSVTVNVQPTAVTVTAASNTICPGSSAVQLTTSGGTVAGATIITENFNGAAAGWTTVNSTTGGSNPAGAAWTLRPSGWVENFTTFTTSDASQFYLSNSDVAGSGNNTLTILTSPVFSTVGFTSASLVYNQVYIDYNSDDFAYVEVSTDGGTTWTTVSTFSTNQGTTTNFETETINLDPYVGYANVRLRFRYVAIWGFYWGIDNVNITGDQVTNITWTPTTGLFTDAAATTPYVGGTAAATVYARPNATTTYTATATSPATCTNNGNTTITYNAAIQPTTALAGTAGGAQVCANYSLATSNNFFSNCNIIATVTPSGGAPVSGNVNACVKIESGLPTAPNGQPYVTRHFDILPATSPTTATATITLYFLQSEFNTYNAGNGGFPDLPTASGDAAGIANLRVAQFNSTTTGGIGGYAAGSGSAINPVDTDIQFANGRWSVSFAATGSGGFYVYTGNFVLPVALLDFKGEQAGAINKLLWSTSSETNNHGFELERSADGKNFSSLSFIATKAENGNSNIALNYNYNDGRPLAGTNYYRLKQVDRDGKFTYSNIVVLKSKLTDITLSSVYPNPATRDLNLVITSPSAEKVTIVITDLTGKILLQQKTQLVTGDNQNRLNVQSLAAGTYLIKAICADGCETAVHRFVKQ